MNIKQEVRGLLVKEQDGGAASMSTNRSHKHGLSIDTMWDDLKPQVHQAIKKYFAEHNLSVQKLKKCGVSENYESRVYQAPVSPLLIKR